MKQGEEEDDDDDEDGDGNYTGLRRPPIVYSSFTLLVCYTASLAKHKQRREVTDYYGCKKQSHSIRQKWYFGETSGARYIGMCAKTHTHVHTL